MKTTLKASVLMFVLMVFCHSGYSQTGGGFGIKGGLNYNSNGQYFKDAEAIWGSPKNNLGYHLGLFGKVNAGPVFLRPELNYTNLKSEINSVQLQTQRLDAPVLVGLNLLGSVVSVFAGPSFHYYIEDELRDFEFDKFNAGYQFGIGLNLGNVGLDLRYERVLNGQTVNIDDVFTGDGDFRFQQLMLGLSFKF
ncbi:outer membrane beta-barrel protein [Cognataquiflexum rubidum]|uniref:outer membrane beta-barrel protein n=1 Tax=Cognataquiflexum rubidum TaxID=2922273 RepID=UPI001F13EFA9|nr:outer membrane beta-barrel protein [Cognataquiflexum rubidum]MCH6235455.1 porin family protein [Cognataquiflexum rubidum]